MSFGFYTGLRGLNAARLGMQLTGHNIANLNTPGFSRQAALQSSTFPIGVVGGFQIGTGAEVSSVRRVVDERLESRIRTQSGLFGRSYIENRRMTEIEGILSEPGGSGLSALMDNYFGAIGKLRADAGSRSLRGGLLQEAQNLSNAFNQLSSRYTRLGEDTLEEVRAELANVNNEAERIANLNSQIISLEANGNAANDLRDQRELSIKKLSELMDTQVVSKANGSLDVLVGGYLIVSAGRSSALEGALGNDGRAEVRVKGTTTGIEVRQGRIAGLLATENGMLADIRGRLDQFASNLILETNRVHSTGMPKTGPFTSLVSDTAAVDGDGDGQFADELLSNAGLPFDIVDGELYVAVTDLQSKDVTRTRIPIQPSVTTMGDLAATLSGIDHLSAFVDPTGRLRINAETGYGFDFTNKLDPFPNAVSTFGSESATLGGSATGPFDMSSASDFQLSVDGGANTTINLLASDFVNPTSVEAGELATVLTQKFGSAGLGIQAVAVGDAISFKTTSTGTSSTLVATDGTNSPLAALGIPTGTTATGRTGGLEIEVQGQYTGSSNGNLRFVADGDGTIGVTKDLTISVYRADGTKIATLPVGEGHDPLDAIEVGDGIQVFVKHGTISGTNGDQFSVDTLADTDTADVLVALGLNSFFTGSNAGDIGVSQRLLDSPDLLSAGLRQAESDNQNLVRMAGLSELSITELGGNTYESFYNDLASDIGFEAKKSKDVLDSENGLLTFLSNERESVSGVNIDEEMVDLVRHQEAYQASARFISILKDMTNVLMGLGR